MLNLNSANSVSVLLLLLVLSVSVTSWEWDFGLRNEQGDRVRRQEQQTSTSNCRAEGNQIFGDWQCKSGQVIPCSQLCNGPKDCLDGSDETPISCSQVFCSDTEFRCAYGGCIQDSLECNGVEDCADGSDEKTINCPGVLDSLRPSGNCGEGFFQCKGSRECIFDDRVCNGKADCVDKTDETAELCSAHFCPESGYRCKYGACVLADAKCDGKQDCHDGSDEGSFCNKNKAPPTSDTDPQMTKPTSFPSHGSAYASHAGHAFLPTMPRPTLWEAVRELLFSQEHDHRAQSQEIRYLRNMLLELKLVNLENGNYELSRPVQVTNPAARAPVYQSVIDSDFRPQPPEGGTCDTPEIEGGRVADIYGQRFDTAHIANGATIKFNCYAGTSLFGVNSTYCINGNLLHDLPICTNMCSGIPLNTLSVQADCFEPTTGNKIPCAQLMPPKTVAVLSCKIGYRPPDRTVPDSYTCMDDGNWNAHAYKCIPICGEVTEGQRFIVGGAESNITQVPWHAAVYENINRTMIQICGGSIITSTAVITAAHCFWDTQFKRMKDTELYRVAVGKTFRDFEAEEATAQKYKAASLKIYEQYMDYEGLFVSDIAVVRLDKPIIFQSYVKPICVEFGLQGNQRYVASGNTGRVAGWGLTESMGDPSPVLKTIDLPTVDFNTCLKESPPSFKPFITTDKFCGGFTTGESVCKGDSGGGLALPRESRDGGVVYYLRGIISVGPILEGSCDNRKYSAFTDIQLHSMFLYEFVLA